MKLHILVVISAVALALSAPVAFGQSAGTSYQGTSNGKQGGPQGSGATGAGAKQGTGSGAPATGRSESSGSGTGSRGTATGGASGNPGKS